METLTEQQPTQIPTQETPPVASTLDSLKQFARETPTPVIPPGNAEAEFSKSSEHTKSSVFSESAQPGNPGQPGSFPSTAGGLRSIGQIVPNSGKFAVSLIHEMALPAIVIYTARQMGYKCDKAGLKLTKEEKDVLTPAWEGWLNSLNISIDKPIYQLLLAIGFVYGSKYMDGSLKFEKLSKAEKLSNKQPEPITVTTENFKDFFDVEANKLVMAEMKKSKKKRADAIAQIQARGGFATLEKELRLKHGIKASENV